MKIGVIRVGGLGDSIVFSPFLRELRKLYPNDEITLFVQHNSSGEYFSRIKYVDKLEYIDKNSSIFTKIGWIFKYFKKYDLVIDTINGAKISCIIANLFGKKTIGFKKHGKYSIAIQENEYNQNDFKSQQDLTILKKLKNIDIKKIKIKLDFPLFDKDYTKTNNYDNYCVFHTGSSKQTSGYYSKNLSDNQINEIINIIISNGYNCVIIGKDTDLEISNIKNHKNLTIINNLNIRELGTLISRSSLYIGANSGPMWIAMALNKKSIIINGGIQNCRIPPEMIFKNVYNINCEYNGCCNCGLYTCKYNKDKTLQGLCMKNLDLNQIKSFISNK